MGDGWQISYYFIESREQFPLNDILDLVGKQESRISRKNKHMQTRQMNWCASNLMEKWFFPSFMSKYK